MRVALGLLLGAAPSSAKATAGIPCHASDSVGGGALPCHPQVLSAPSDCLSWHLAKTFSFLSPDMGYGPFGIVTPNGLAATSITVVQGSFGSARSLCDT
jgi:hypothetical protein